MKQTVPILCNSNMISVVLCIASQWHASVVNQCPVCATASFVGVLVIIIAQHINLSGLTVGWKPTKTTARPSTPVRYQQTDGRDQDPMIQFLTPLFVFFYCLFNVANSQTRAPCESVGFISYVVVSVRNDTDPDEFRVMLQRYAQVSKHEYKAR